MIVSLLAAAAVMAGLLASRSRQAEPTPETDANTGVSDALQLEALRNAGI